MPEAGRPDHGYFGLPVGAFGDLAAGGNLARLDAEEDLLRSLLELLGSECLCALACCHGQPLAEHVVFEVLQGRLHLVRVLLDAVRDAR